MTKKHFISLADALRVELAHGCLSGLDDAEQARFLQMIGSWCQQQNPLFNGELWRRYIAGECGPSGGAVK